jgi:hypothetical protein
MRIVQQSLKTQKAQNVKIKKEHIINKTINTKWSKTGFIQSIPLKISAKKRGNVRINVILRRVRGTIFTMENIKCYLFWVCFFSISNQARKVYAPFCHVWPVWLYYYVFPHYIYHKRHCFRKQKKLLNIKCVFCLKHFSWEGKFCELHCHKCTEVFT